MGAYDLAVKMRGKGKSMTGGEQSLLCFGGCVVVE